MNVRRILQLFLLGSLAFSWTAHATNGDFFGTSFNTGATWWRNGSTLDLDFVNDRYYLTGSTYSGIANFITAAGGTFSRGSTATYYDSTGTLQTAAANTPRLDHDPATGEAKGILIEESSTNQLEYSSSFSTAPWGFTTAITETANAATAPDGSTTAYLVSANGATLSYIYQNGLPSVASATVTRSLYVKPGTTSNIYFEFHDGGLFVASFNLSAKTSTWGTGGSGCGPISIISLPNGWFRIAATYTYSASGTSNYVTYIGGYGNGTGNLYLWGAQLEYKAFPTSYIATTSSTVTRSADSFSIPTAAWFNATTGTFLSWAYGQLNSTQTNWGRIIGGDSGYSFSGLGGNLTSISTYNGTALNGGGTVTASSSTAIKMAFAWDQNAGTESEAMSSSVLTTGSLSGNWSSANIYPGGSNFDPLNASVRRITFFPVRMPNAYLQNMTH